VELLAHGPLTVVATVHPALVAVSFIQTAPLHVAIARAVVANVAVTQVIAVAVVVAIVVAEAVASLVADVQAEVGDDVHSRPSMSRSSST
jgi:hypothetical protein